MTALALTFETCGLIADAEDEALTGNLRISRYLNVGTGVDRVARTP
jgi:hypothetical protein